MIRGAAERPHSRQLSQDDSSPECGPSAHPERPGTGSAAACGQGETNQEYCSDAVHQRGNRENASRAYFHQIGCVFPTAAVARAREWGLLR